MYLKKTQTVQPPPQSPPAYSPADKPPIPPRGAPPPVPQRQSSYESMNVTLRSKNNNGLS